MTISVSVSAQMTLSRAGSKLFDAGGVAVPWARASCADASFDIHRTGMLSLAEKLVEYVRALVLQRF
jgi:hypothetical protein